MSDIHEFLQQTSRDAAIRALSQAMFWNDQDPEARPADVDANVTNMGEALSLFEAWSEIGFAEIAWIYARALEMLSSAVVEEPQIGELQRNLLQSIEERSTDPSFSPYSTLITSCLIECGRSFLKRFGIGSRALVGTVLMVSKSADALHELALPDRVLPYDYSEMRRVPGQLAAPDIASRLADVAISYSLRLGGVPHWAMERYHAAIVLCTPIAYRQPIRYQVPWCELTESPEHSQVLMRTDSEVFGRLSSDDCQRIEERLTFG